MTVYFNLPSLAQIIMVQSPAFNVVARPLFDFTNDGLLAVYRTVVGLRIAPIGIY